MSVGKASARTSGRMAQVMNPAALGALLLVALFVTGCVAQVGTATRAARPSLHDRAQLVREPAVTVSSTADLVARVIGDNEDVWDSLFHGMGGPPYAKATVVMFSGSTSSSCGMIGTSKGPFYCERDRRIYIDTAYFNDPLKRFDAGDFGPAFLIAHEFAHHIQSVLGPMAQADAAMPQKKRTQGEMRVLRELQADCFAGVWTYFVKMRNLLEADDVDQGLPAALAVGDPRSNGHAVERVRWFQQGLATGDPRQCNTNLVAPR